MEVVKEREVGSMEGDVEKMRAMSLGAVVVGVVDDGDRRVIVLLIMVAEGIFAVMLVAGVGE